MILIDEILNIVKKMIRQDRNELHTFALGKIVTFDPVNMRATVYLLENVKFNGIFYPSQTIVDCVVQFPKTKNFYVRVPYYPEDKVVLAFCESNIADIAITGERTNQTLTRRHSEDDIVVIGGWISEQNDNRLIGDNQKDITIVNSLHNSKITFTEDNTLNIMDIDTINVKCNTGNVTANQTNITSETNITGNVNIVGQVDIQGATKISTTLDVGASVKTPTVSATNSLSVAGKEMKGHTHSYLPGSGSPTETGQPS